VLRPLSSFLFLNPSYRFGRGASVPAYARRSVASTGIGPIALGNDLGVQEKTQKAEDAHDRFID
jgi:hypothetical protein